MSKFLRGVRKGRSKMVCGHATVGQGYLVRLHLRAHKVRLHYRRAALKVEYGFLSITAAGWTKVGRAAEPICIWLGGQSERAGCYFCQFVAIKLRLYLLRLLVLGYEALVLVNERRHLLLICQQRLLHITDVSQQLNSHSEQLGLIPLNSKSIGDGLDAGER